MMGTAQNNAAGAHGCVAGARLNVLLPHTPPPAPKRLLSLLGAFFLFAAILLIPYPSYSTPPTSPKGTYHIKRSPTCTQNDKNCNLNKNIKHLNKEIEKLSKQLNKVQKRLGNVAKNAGPIPTQERIRGLQDTMKQMATNLAAVQKEIHGLSSSPPSSPNRPPSPSSSITPYHIKKMVASPR